MSNVLDVAAATLVRFDTSLSTAQLQVLLSLSQGWSMAMRGEPLFPEELHAWSTGPTNSHL